MIILWDMPDGWHAGSDDLGKIWQDHHVARRIGADGHGPHDLIEIERIDVLVDHDNNLCVAKSVGCRQHAYANRFGKSTEPGLRGHNEDEAMRLYSAFTATTSGNMLFDCAKFGVLVVIACRK